MEDEFKELFTPAASAIPDSRVQALSRSIGHRKFKSEQEAREWMFGTLEHWDKQSWADIFGKEGPAKNRWFAENFPAYQDRFGYWRLGKPLTTWSKETRHKAAERRKREAEIDARTREATFRRQYPGWRYYDKKGRFVPEYLSNETSDFSDGTNGDPASLAPSTGDLGTVPGLPDYKYVERSHQKKLNRLRALLQRRDPGGISQNPLDIELRRSLGENEEDDDLVKEMSPPKVLLQKVEGAENYYYVSLSDGSFLGSIRADIETPSDTTIPTLRRMWAEFPWLSLPSFGTTGSRHRTKDEAIDYLARVNAKEVKTPGYGPEYWERHDQVHREEQEKLKQQLMQGEDPKQVAEALLEMDEEDYKDVYMPGAPIGYIVRNLDGATAGQFFAHNTNRGTFTRYIGDARVYKKKSTWMRGWPEYFQKGFWEILPIFHDPRKVGMDALSSAEPRRFFFKQRLKDKIGEAADDDDLVKDVSGDVNMTLDEFVNRYDAVPVPGILGANTFWKYFWRQKELGRLVSYAQELGISANSQDAHIWGMMKFGPKSGIPGAIVLIPEIVHDNGDQWTVPGWFLTRQSAAAPGADGSLQLVASDVLQQAGYI